MCLLCEIVNSLFMVLINKFVTVVSSKDCALFSYCTVGDFAILFVIILIKVNFRRISYTYPECVKNNSVAFQKETLRTLIILLSSCTVH